MSVADAALSRNAPLTPSLNHSATKVGVHKTQPRYWSPDEEERLAYLREVEGLSPARIAPILNRSKDSVEAKMARMGLELPHDWQGKRCWGSTLPPHQLAQVKRFWMRGDCVKVAAEALGLYEPRVTRAYRQFCEEERALPDLPAHIGTFIGAKEMAAIVAPVVGVRASAIFGPSRLKPMVCARIAIAKALRDRGISTPIIARSIGRSDHSTILHLLKQFEPYCQVYPETLRAYKAIKRAEEIAAERLAA